MRFGTWISLTIRCPSSARATLGSARAAASACARGVSGGRATVPRSLPVHLHRDRHRSRPRAAPGRPPARAVRPPAGRAGRQPRVHLLGQMRHHRRDQPGQGRHRLAPRPAETGVGGGALRLGDRIGEFVQPRDRDVEGEALQRLGHRGDGAVGGAAQRQRGGAEGLGRRAGGHGRPRLGQAEQPLGEAVGARHAGLGPFHVALGRVVGQDEPARGVGAVAGDDGAGIDRVALRLAHRLDPADGDRARRCRDARRCRPAGAPPPRDRARRRPRPR